ncbi:MAG: HIRAN domain-containing protein [Smithella sp.]
METYIAGWQYHLGDKVLKLLRKDTPLALLREPDNPHDNMAVAIYGVGVMMGYIPRIHNTVIARMIDQNAPVKARVLRKHKIPHPWDKMEIRVTIAAQWHA